MCCSRTQEVGGTLVIDLWSIDLPANGVPQAEVSSRAQATRPPVVGSRPVGATQPPIPWERHSLPERVAEEGPASLARMRPLSPPECRET